MLKVAYFELFYVSTKQLNSFGFIFFSRNGNEI